MYPSQISQTTNPVLPCCRGWPARDCCVAKPGLLFCRWLMVCKEEEHLKDVGHAIRPARLELARPFNRAFGKKCIVKERCYKYLRSADTAANQFFIEESKKDDEKPSTQHDMNQHPLDYDFVAMPYHCATTAALIVAW